MIQGFNHAHVMLWMERREQPLTFRASGFANKGKGLKVNPHNKIIRDEAASIKQAVVVWAMCYPRWNSQRAVGTAALVARYTPRSGRRRMVPVPPRIQALGM